MSGNGVSLGATGEDPAGNAILYRYAIRYSLLQMTDIRTARYFPTSIYFAVPDCQPELFIY